jgi:alkylation response protein AidB-like acyl-CoA dehydrogenase
LTSLKTRARRDGDSYIVDGQKVWSTAAKVADYGYLLARTEPDPGPSGVSAFILDMRSPGVDARPLREITGGEDFCEVFFDGVRVPASNIIGAPGEGWKVAQVSLAAERGGVGGMAAEEWLAGLVRLARGHRRAGRPAIDDSDVRQRIAGFAARVQIQRYLGYRVATKALEGTFDPWDAPHLKIWGSELNLETVEYGLELQGARSILSEDDPDAADEGWWQDSYLYARALTIAGGSNEVMRNMIAERGLGLPREPRGG